MKIHTEESYFALVQNLANFKNHGARLILDFNGKFSQSFWSRISDVPDCLLYLEDPWIPLSEEELRIFSRQSKRLGVPFALDRAPSKLRLFSDTGIDPDSPFFLYSIVKPCSEKIQPFVIKAAENQRRVVVTTHLGTAFQTLLVMGELADEYVNHPFLFETSGLKGFLSWKDPWGLNKEIFSSYSPELQLVETKPEPGWGLDSFFERLPWKTAAECLR